MISGRVAESNKGARRKVKIGHLIIQSLYNMFVFTATTHDDWFAVIKKGSGLYCYMGFFLGLDIFKALLYFYDLIVSKNKNVGKVFSFLRELAAGVLTIIAGVGGFTTSITISIITPYLYFTSMLINIAYNFTIALHNAYHWAVSNDKEASNRYKESFKKHMFGVVLAGVLTTALSIVMFTQIASTAMVILSACLNAVTFLIGVHEAYKIHQAEKKSNELISSNNLNIMNSNNNSTKKLQVDLKKQPKVKVRHDNLESQKYDDDYYFHYKGRVDLIGEQDNPKNYLLEQISKKVICLKLEISQDNNKLFSQETKRRIKIGVLEKLKNLIQNPHATLQDFHGLLNEPEFNNFFNNPFQSFLRQKGDTQDIFEAAELYFSQLNPGKSSQALQRIA